ncbi:monosaccharide ABC transporter ATP-binding protein, CUT2 family [Cribrihabitans marinus]|uniref:Monosaccharide ABC transporter ATP-binding protein, CUT2 family n=1 Tax=Cribrihabitans marinus TaxID=1227549 RepID=A0A1H6WE62_9RHOB|nr:sugar ABC transporter ATP-binding protein [Cribrihabitans marinus]GGH24783.1 ABC transporter ATP-binding protein [Cribrihabitans marinus]SEJ11110.1 monosaccharide ABC transporter ATP-binding protein, CUT2 family [Cribrihabitans marinus]
MYQLNQVDKRFPGVHALKAVDFTIGRGEIVGLVGENGAGKSTLMKVIYGAYQPDGGTVTIDGKTVRFQNPRQAMEHGIGMVFQEQSLITNLTVMENIFLGFEQQFVRWGVIDWKAMAEAARHQLRKVKMDIDPSMTTSKLSFAQRQLVELAKVLTLEERIDGDLVILLDEPTSVLAKEEVELLFGLVRELTSRASFIFVSHRLDEVLELSDRIYVMKDGAVVDVVAQGTAEVDRIQHKMVGRDVDKEYYREQKQKPYDPSQTLVSFDGVGVAGKFSEISFDLHPGEVLCLVGTEGSGREAILRTIFGLEQPSTGTVLVKGAPYARANAQQAVARGVGYVPRERKVEGIVNGMNVYENMTLSQMRRYASGGVLRIGEEKALAQHWIDRLGIKTPDVYKDCGGLSGGNQQKVVLAKWRSGGSDIILLDHPTRGLDIGAKEDVYDMVREMSDAGAGIVLVADTLEEAIGLSHTILVLKDGIFQKRFDGSPGDKPTLYDLVHHMI